MGPCPIQLVVPIAVKNAVSAATNTFTASSITRCFFIIYLLSALFSPPKFLRPFGSKRQSRARGSQRGSEPSQIHRILPHCLRLFRPPLTPPDSGGEEITRLLRDARRRHHRCHQCSYRRPGSCRHRSGNRPECRHRLRHHLREPSGS